MKTYKFMIIFLLVLFVNNCNDNLVGPNFDNSFYPLKNGNMWEYKYELYDSSGVLTSQGTFKDTIIGDTIENSLPAFEIESPWFNDPACCDYHYYLQNNHQGTRFLILFAPRWIINNLIYKYPCSQGDYFVSADRNHDTTFVYSLHDTVICEAGTFDCIVYKQNIKDPIAYKDIRGYEYTYVAYGIGKIKVEIFSFNNEHTLIKELKFILNNYKLYK